MQRGQWRDDRARIERSTRHRPAAVQPRSSGASPSAGGAVTGSIVVSGSSTVQPISEAVSEAFKEQNPGFDYTVEGPGTGDGFKKFCAGETDISDASRKIKADDTEDGVCKTNGVDYVELKVAIDGISVMTSPQQQRRHLPQLPRPVRAGRPGVDRLRQVERRRRARQGAGLQHDVPRCRADDHRPR